MRSTSILFLPVLLAFLSCSKPKATSNSENTALNTQTTTPKSPTSAPGPAENCPAFFYYYNQEKIPLKVYAPVLLIGFEKAQTPEARRSLQSRFPEIEKLGTEQTANAGTFSIVNLKANVTCNQTLALAEKLQQQPEVLFANPAFKTPQTLETENAWAGLTSEFLVTLKSASEINAFKQTVAETKTTILDTLGETTFLLQATKNSKGNALQMANFFQEKPFVQNAEPDFFMATPNIPVSEK